MLPHGNPISSWEWTLFAGKGYELLKRLISDVFNSSTPVTDIHQKKGMPLEKSEGKDILGRCFCRPIVTLLGTLNTASFLEKSQNII